MPQAITKPKQALSSKGATYRITIHIMPLTKPHTAFDIVLFGAVIGEEIKKIAPNKIIPEHSSIITEITLPVEILGKRLAIMPTARIKQIVPIKEFHDIFIADKTAYPYENKEISFKLSFISGSLYFE